MTARLSLRLALCGLSLLDVALPPSAEAQLRDERHETLTAHDGTSFVITHGTVRVPERRDITRSAATIDLAVVRVRRHGSSVRTAHVMLAGGPGDSGVNIALGMARQGGAALSDVISGDFVGFDQRGTGKSLPNLETPAVYDLPLDRPGSPELWTPIMDRVARRVAAEVTARGIHLPAYNSRESADDVDAVRRALGYERVTLWGRSYGSHLALATVRQHPDTVQRLVLVSPEGPNHTWKLPSQVDAVLQRVSARAGLPSFLPNMRQVIDRLSAAPVVVAVADPGSGQSRDVTIGAFDVQWITANALGDPRALVMLPALFRELAAGDFRRLAQISLLRRTRLGVQSAMKHVMDASSGATQARRDRITRESASAILGDAINYPGPSLSDAWGSPDLGDAYRAAVKSPVPALLIVGDLDPRTPVENATEIADTLPNARVVVLENATHQFDLFGSPTLRALLGRFLSGDAAIDPRIVLPPLQFQQ
jgi:pimeloyl-ACP methyl ester carboxylesterase